LQYAFTELLSDDSGKFFEFKKFSIIIKLFVLQNLCRTWQVVV